MKSTNRLIIILGVLAAFTATPSVDAAIVFHVTVNSLALTNPPGSTGAPFALDFQLNGGNALANSVTLSNFTFATGSANNNPAATTFGLASGSLTTTVTIADSSSSFSNEFYQGFTAGTTVGFDVNVTTNVNGPTPDTFSFAILDGSLANLATNGPGDSLLLVDINSATPTPQTYASTNGVTVTVSPVPEPTTAALLGLGLVGACGVIRRRRAA